MNKINWDEVADREFAAMDRDTQAQWIDLRHRLGV